MDGIIYGSGNAAAGKNIIMPQYDGQIRQMLINGGRDMGSGGVRLNCFDRFAFEVLETPDKLRVGAGIAMYNDMIGVLPAAAEFALHDYDGDTLERIDIIFELGGGTEPDSFGLLPVYGGLVNVQVYDTNNCTAHSVAQTGFWRETLICYETDYADYTDEMPLCDSPYKSQYAGEAVNVTGSLFGGVTGVTQPADDNSGRIATTQYVKNQIQKDINYDTANITPLAGLINFYRKAKYVYCYGRYTATAESIMDADGYDSFTVPDGFTLKTGETALLSFVMNPVGSLITYTRCYTLSGDTATFAGDAGLSASGGDVLVSYCFGYPTD